MLQRPLDLMLCWQVDVLELFDVFREEIFVGDYPDRSADNKLNALENMIESVDGLIVGDDISGACQQLNDAYKKLVGAWNSSFVAGEAASKL